MKTATELTLRYGDDPFVIRISKFINTSKNWNDNDRYPRYLLLYWRYVFPYLYTYPPDIKEEEKASLPTPFGYIPRYS